MWLLCLVAFLLGALLTWLLLARPARREAARARAVAEQSGRERDEPVDPVRAAQAPPTPIPGVPRHARPSGGGNPALPALGRRRRPGSSALGAPARLRHDTPEGTSRGGADGPVVPRQPGPGPRGGGSDGPVVPPQDRGHALFTPPEPRPPEPDEPPDVPPRREPPDERR
jgi:hypothetical protein